MDKRIEQFLKSQDSRLDIRFAKLVIDRLESFSYTLKEEDVLTVGFSIIKTENKIKNSTHATNFPDGLIMTAVDLTIGEFFLAKKQTSEFEAVVKQVQTGDSSVTFDTSKSPEQRMDEFISSLILKGEQDLLCYRKLVW